MTAQPLALRSVTSLNAPASAMAASGTSVVDVPDQDSSSGPTTSIDAVGTVTTTSYDGLSRVTMTQTGDRITRHLYDRDNRKVGVMTATLHKSDLTLLKLGLTAEPNFNSFSVSSAASAMQAFDLA